MRLTIFLLFHIVLFSKEMVFESNIGKVPYQAVIYDEKALSNGNIYVTLHNVSDPHACILSKDGKEVLMKREGHYHLFKKFNDTIVLTHKIGYPTPLYNYQNFRSTVLRHIGAWEFFDSNFNPLNTYDQIDSRGFDYHDLVILKNGNLLFFATDEREFVDDSGKMCLALDGIIKEKAKDNTTIFQWNSKNYFSLDDAIYCTEFDKAHRHEFLKMVEKTADFYDYFHPNSLFVDQDDNLLISSRHMSSITKINRKTGEIIWILGGKNNQFQFIDDPLNGFSCQHTASILENGNLLLYDNGNHHKPPLTRVVEYQLDEIKKTATLVWDYHDHKFTYACGSCQRLETGNTLIGWGWECEGIGDGRQVVEVTKEKEKVLEIQFPAGSSVYAAYKIE